MDPESTSTDTEAGSTPAEGEQGSTPESTEAKTPKTFDEAYVKTLRKEAASARTELASTKTQLAELLDRDKSESERLSERVAASERRASEAEARAARYEVAAEHGLDLKVAGALAGTTREEIDASAKVLAEVIEARKSPPPAGGFDGGARERSAEAKTPEAAHNDLLLRALGRQP